jgi:hypothetical protein
LEAPEKGMRKIKLEVRLQRSLQAPHEWDSSISWIRCFFIHELLTVVSGENNVTKLGWNNMCWHQLLFV